MGKGAGATRKRVMIGDRLVTGGVWFALSTLSGYGLFVVGLLLIRGRFGLRAVEGAKRRPDGAERKRSYSEPTANLRLLLEQPEWVLGTIQTERRGKAEGEKKGSGLWAFATGMGLKENGEWRI